MLQIKIKVKIKLPLKVCKMLGKVGKSLTHGNRAL